MADCRLFISRSEAMRCQSDLAVSSIKGYISDTTVSIIKFVIDIRSLVHAVRTFQGSKCHRTLRKNKDCTWFVAGWLLSLAGTDLVPWSRLFTQRRKFSRCYPLLKPRCTLFLLLKYTGDRVSALYWKLLITKLSWWWRACSRLTIRPMEFESQVID